MFDGNYFKILEEWYEYLKNEVECLNNWKVWNNIIYYVGSIYTTYMSGMDVDAFSSAFTS